MKKNAADDLFHKRIINKIKNIRIKKKLSRLDVAIEGGLNPNYYARIERGKTGNIQNGTMIKIKRGLGTSWEELFGPQNIITYYLAELEKNYPENES